MNKKLKPYEKTEVAYKEILEVKKKAYEQKKCCAAQTTLGKSEEKNKELNLQVTSFD